jgi:methylphosphotriester-DNA--protein-cysteine methyltransferase
VTFKTAAEAEAAGYTRAKNCQAEGGKSETKTTSSTTPTMETKTTQNQTSTSSSSKTETATGDVIGNKNSKIYHLPGCPGYKTVSEKNQVVFKSAAEAEAAGYTKAKNCNAGESKTSTTSKTTKPTTEPAKPTATSEPTQTTGTTTTPEAGQIVGNKNSKKYHLPGCPSYDSVSEKNRVYFKTAAEAEAAGYTKAGNCNK